MHYDLIRNFVTVAKTQNITRTAEILYVSQSTVSHRLQLLEDTLGHPLVYRGRGKRVASLTEHGKSFLPIAEKWLNLWQETEAFRAEAPRQHLRIACVGSLATCLLSKFFMDFSVQNPNIHLSMQVLGSEEIYSQMNQSLLDIGIVLSNLPLQSLQIRPLLSEKMYCVCANSMYPNRKHIDTALLEPSCEILLDWGVEFKLWHDFRFPTMVTPKMEVNDVVLIRQALQSFDCWSIVPETVATPFVRQGVCRCLTLKNPPPDRVSYVLTPALPTHGTDELIRLFQNELDSFIANHLGQSLIDKHRSMPL